MLRTIIIFLIVLSILVIIHELAHFLVAIWNKVWVKEFGIGFPPRIKKLFKWGNTDFFINAIPIGGYVSLAGETDTDDKSESEEEVVFQAETKGKKSKSEKVSKKESEPKVPKSMLFYNKSIWQRAAIIGAGPISNIVFGALMFAVVFCIVGIPFAMEGAFIGYVQEGSPAMESGMQPNTQVLSVDTGEELVEIFSSQQLISLIGANRGQEIIVNTSDTCVGSECDGFNSFPVRVRTVEETPAGQGAVGIAFMDYNFQFFPWYQQIPLGIARGFQQSFEMAVLILDSLGQMISGIFAPAYDAPELDVVGPVGMVNQINQHGIFDAGFLAIVQFAAILSVNLGIMNLLPFPALDGGKLIMIFVGAVVGRKKVAKVEAYLDMIGFALLILLMIAITTRDIWQIFQS
ncbi:MAG: site-2 protease family protein [Pseudomonadales bacterium]|jgi:regulator of sigma E protease|nr:site-2 protease family protein [Pseudomonadales bacterium]